MSVVILGLFDVFYLLYSKPFQSKLLQALYTGTNSPPPPLPISILHVPRVWLHSDDFPLENIKKSTVMKDWSRWPFF